jgi:hypothetical protein
LNPARDRDTAPEITMARRFLPPGGSSKWRCFIVQVFDTIPR